MVVFLIGMGLSQNDGLVLCLGSLQVLVPSS